VQATCWYAKALGCPGNITHLMRVRSHWDAKRARQPKVRQFQLVAHTVNEEVLWLEVTVQDPVGQWTGVR